MNRWSTLLALAGCVAACGPGDLGPDGGSDDVDASAGMGGLVFRFTAPQLDMDLGGVVITRLRMNLVDLRAIGDAAPGEDTYLAATEVDLHDTDRPEVVFENAPPGRYSAFEFSLERMSDSEAAWELEGTVDVDSDTFTLEVEDDASAPVSLSLGALDLSAGETIEVTLAVDFAYLLETASIDWDAAPVEDGETIVIDDDEPALLAAMHAALLASIYVESITPVE